MIDSTDVQFDAFLKRLHLANARRAWRELVQRAEREMSYRDFLALLVTEEIAQRLSDRRLLRGLRFVHCRPPESLDSPRLGDILETGGWLSGAVPTDILHFPARVVVTPTDAPHPP